MMGYLKPPLASFSPSVHICAVNICQPISLGVHNTGQGLFSGLSTFQLSKFMWALRFFFFHWFKTGCLFLSKCIQSFLFSEVLDVISGSFRYSLHFLGWLDTSENKVCGSRLGPGPNHIPWRADRSSSNSGVVAANCWKVMSLQLPQGPKLCPGPGKISMPSTQHIWQKIGKNCRSTFRRTTSSMSMRSSAAGSDSADLIPSSRPPKNMISGT